MVNNTRNSVSSIGLFTEALDTYEASIKPGSISPYQYSNTTVYLESAVNRIISASTVDAYQMMRALADRILTGNVEAYSERVILMLMAGSSNNLFRAGVTAVIYTLLQVMKGSDVDLGLSWKNRIRNNGGIIAFMTNWNTSDQKVLSGISVSNKVILTGDEKITVTNDPIVNFPISVPQQQLTLNGSTLQIVKFAAPGAFTSPPGHVTGQSLTFKGSVILKPAIGEVLISNLAKFTPGVKEIMRVLDCVDKSGNASGHMPVKTPANFYAIQLDVFSIDSGASWTVGNLQILPPTLK